MDRHIGGAARVSATLLLQMVAEPVKRPRRQTELSVSNNRNCNVIRAKAGMVNRGEVVFTLGRLTRQ